MVQNSGVAPKSVQALDSAYLFDPKGEKMVLRERIEFGGFACCVLILNDNSRPMSTLV